MAITKTFAIRYTVSAGVIDSRQPDAIVSACYALTEIFFNLLIHFKSGSFYGFTFSIDRLIGTID